MLSKSQRSPRAATHHTMLLHWQMHPNSHNCQSVRSTCQIQAPIPNKRANRWVARGQGLRLGTGAACTSTLCLSCELSWAEVHIYTPAFILSLFLPAKQSIMSANPLLRQFQRGHLGQIEDSTLSDHPDASCMGLHGVLHVFAHASPIFTCRVWGLSSPLIRRYNINVPACMGQQPLGRMGHKNVAEPHLWRVCMTYSAWGNKMLQQPQGHMSLRIGLLMDMGVLTPCFLLLLHFAQCMNDNFNPLIS